MQPRITHGGIFQTASWTLEVAKAKRTIDLGDYSNYKRAVPRWP